MAVLIQSITFGVAVLFILVGVVGTIIPLLPGTLLIWLTILFYTIAERASGFAAIDPLTFIVLTIIALVTGLADVWLPLVGAQKRGASRRSMMLGIVGSLIGTILLPLLGTIIGYVVGVLLGEYHKFRDWDRAVRAGLGGLAGWGIGTAIQLGGGLLMFLIFVWQVLAFQTG